MHHYNAQQEGKKELKVTMIDAVRFIKMPDYVKNVLRACFKELKKKQTKEEAPLQNVPQK